MELTKVGLLIVLAAISANAVSVNPLFPADKEVVYDWKALVKAGSLLPAPHASVMAIHGKVHVQAGPNSTHVKITDITHKLYNGILNHVHEHDVHSIPAPQEVKDLEHVFKIVHNEKGLAVGIATEAQEKEYSRNMKKAIASIFQMDHSVLKTDSHHHHYPHAEVIDEHSVYGYGKVDYNVHHHDENTIEVSKMHDMQHSDHMYQRFFTNVELGHCDLDFDESIMHTSHRKYIIVKEKDCQIAKHIEASGAVLYYPHKGQSDSQYLIVNQTFEMVSEAPVQQQLHVQSEHFENHLTYKVFDESVENEAIVDATNGRHTVDYEKIIPVVQQTLKDLVHYLHENHIHTEEPNIQKEHLVERVQRLLMFFNVEKLKELHKTLSGEDAEIFLNILPSVGSKGAALFIKHLIVNKEVNEHDAVKLLEDFPEQTMIPSAALVKEMEELIHLGENIPWKVRKMAILSFGTLVYKSHVYHKKLRHQTEHYGEDQHHQHQEHDSHHEDTFKKYVDEYVNKAKSATEYKVQMVYITGLMNMRLHSIVEPMMSIIKGEWGHNHHLRFLALMAVGPAVLENQDSDEIFEVLWPILTDHDELTEMRIGAYYYLMESRPSHSRLANIFSTLMTEPNEEVYHFHYTYAHTMMKSSEPCKQLFRVKLAKLMKFVHPPSHGLSSAHLADYRDTIFKFSGGLQTYMITTNHSQILSFITSTQDAHIYHEDYVFYLKVHGLRQAVDMNNLLLDLTTTTKKTLPNIHEQKGIHIEFSVMKHGHAISAYYFDEHNLNELSELLDYFTKDTQSVNHKFLNIHFEKNHRMFLPTDLGTPVVWSYVMPMVHHNQINISKEMINKLVKVDVNTKFATSVHYRHGLTFYNPIADAWHGIGRYHTADSVWPINFEITLNTQQQSVQLSWKKSSDEHTHVAGLRSYVKQMVFLKDSHNGNTLTQSCANCKSHVTVTKGKQYRKDFTLCEDDDLNTGHKYHVGVYDSERHISNGTFEHFIHRISSSYGRHYETPFAHFLVTYSNWERYLLEMPEVGPYGFIIKVEPSHEHAVSNIDLSFRVNVENTNDKDVYTPGMKLSTRLTYAVKNKEQSLKTWDINTLVDMNAGHTVNNLKMHLTRIVPGQKDYKVCVEGIKKYTQKGVTGHLNIAMSQTPDGKCVKDDTVIDVTMTGERSYEQEHEHHSYGACDYPIPYFVPHYHTLHCLAAQTTVRHYVYNIKTTNVPTEFKKTLSHWWDYLRAYYMSYYNFEDEHDVDIGDNNLKVDVVYPMQVQQVDIHVTTPHHKHSLTGIPTRDWRWLGVLPDSTLYSKRFMFMHSIGQIDHCTVHHDHHSFNHHYFQDKVPNDWTLYMGDAAENPQEAIYVKQVADNKIAIKAVHKEHVIEVVPHGGSHQVTIDGKEVQFKRHHHEDWVACHMFTQDVGHPIAVMLPQSGIHFELSGHHAVILAPKTEHQMHGHCYGQH